MIHLTLKQPLVLSSSAQSNAAGTRVLAPSSPSPPSSAAAARRSSRRHAARISCKATEEAGAGGGVSAATVEKLLTVTATVEASPSIGRVYMGRGLDDIGDIFGKTLLLELVSSQLNPKTGLEKETVQAFAHKTLTEGRFEAKFQVPASFGPVGAVLVENEHHREMFIKEIRLVTGSDTSGAVTFDCNSWVHSKFESPEKRVFFTVKSYLPADTPAGLEDLRRKELRTLRGDGHGQRKRFERVYDYDVYNDLGNPEHDSDLSRPVLGGAKYPYPRRCRTGRPRTKKEEQTEKREGDFYVPRDEQFSEIKQLTFGATTLRSALHAVLPALRPLLVKKELRFPHFPAIDNLYNDGIPLPKQTGFDAIRSIVPRMIKFVEDTTEHVLRFETPELVERDRFAWFKDEEFGRQTLAGLNPLGIQLLTEFPIKSKLDPEEYGPAESAITREILEKHMNGTTVDDALAAKRLFVLDYHDVFVPYVHKVRALQEATLYASRTVFFLTDLGTLMPLAIELTRPQSKAAKQPQWRQVFTHGPDATDSWLWKLAKANVLSHDTGYHQLVSHWLRTHAAVEPYIIAANRQLSRLHPVYRLLDPHFRYTMEINALARESLVNANGIIEEAFWPGKYAFELSSVAYAATWQFDTEALPNDLVRRGMAVRREDGELELTIKDYPYANDGLMVWDATKLWASDYVSFYYKSDEAVAADGELQAFWEEVRTVGHGDKKDEPWWPVLDGRASLVETLTTIMWVTSGHHAAVNFGQYHFAGYFPNRPTTIRKKMPVEESREDDMKKFMERPETTLLEMLPTQMQAVTVLTTLDILSSHSPDEEYMGEHAEASWLAEPLVKAAFEKFCGRMKEIEGFVDENNSNQELMNRCGAGIVPYELLKPYSKPGVTGRGIPYSISI